MQAHKGESPNPAPQKKDKLEALLRQEESKLLDLLTTVARKSGDVVEPTKERNKSRSSGVFAKERAGSIRPGISSLQRENATTKSAVVELQALLDQSFLDMENLRAGKDEEIRALTQAMEKMTDQMEALRDKGTAIAHYSNLFISSTLTGIERGNISCPKTTQMFLSKLSETTGSLIRSSEFLEDGDIFHAAEVSQSCPNRRSSLNLIPFSRADSVMSSVSDNVMDNNVDEVEELLAHRLVQMPNSLEEIIELMFLEFACMEHSRMGTTAARLDNFHLLSETYMTKRNFLAMCLVLDLIDSRLTLLAAKSCFEKYAFLSERGQRKFNNRLTINSFVECLLNMAAFKFPDCEPDSAEAMQKIVDVANMPALLSNRTMLQGLQDVFIDFCHPGVFETFAQNQPLLLKAYKRSASYGVRSTVSTTSEKISPMKHTTAVHQEVVNSFNHFCTNHKVVPILTRESVVTRISMYMSSYSADGVRFFMGCLLTLCVGLSRSDDTNDITTFPNIGIINAVLERILLQVEAHI